MQQISPQDSSANTGNTAPLLQSTHDAQTVVVSKKEPLQRGAAGEYIAADAPHWRREPFIPVATEDLGVELAKLPGIQANQFRHAVAKIVRHVTRHDQIRRRRLARCFAPLDPDREVVRIDAEVVGPDQFPKMLKLLDDLLQRAAYTRLAEDEIKGYIGVASAWGVHVHVDFEQLGHWAVYSRGDVCGIRPRRHWRKFWRPVTTEVPLYQRMVVVFEIKPEAKVIGEQLSTGRMHLRLFKNIPKVDIDMLLPSTRPKLTWFDQTKVLVPTIGKVSLSIFKIVRAILLVTIISLHATFSLIVLAVGAIAYIIRGVFVYLQTRDRLLLNMTRSLYFQKLDSGAGVLWNLCQNAMEQEIEEAMVVAAVLMQAAEPLGKQELQTRGAALISEIAQVEVILRVDEGLKILDRCGLIEMTPEDRYRLNT